MRALYTAATGMAAQELNVQVISNNIANLRTTGYKKQRAAFQDLIYDHVRRVGAQASDQGTILPVGVDLGGGVKTVGTPRLMSQGTLSPTGNDLDIAIRGEGFFKIQMPDGTYAYTRDGSFMMDAQGRIVTAQGNPVQPTITIPQNSSQITINAQGQVTVMLPGSTTPTTVGQIGLTRFINKAGLQPIGDNLFTDTAGLRHAAGRHRQHRRFRRHAAVQSRTGQRRSGLGNLRPDRRAARLRDERESRQRGRPDAAIHHQHVPLRTLTMIARSLLLATALLAATAPACLAQSRGDTIATPVLRAAVNVTSDIVRIGDIVDYAGAAAQIPIYRAPDLGTTGTLPVAQVLNTLRAHQVIGVDTRDLKEISVTRLARTLEGKEIEQQVARALERSNGLGDAANLSLTFDRDVPAMSGSMPPTPARCSRRPCATSRAATALTLPSRSPTRTARRRPSCASPGQRDRDGGGRGAGPQCRARRRAEIFRRRRRAPPEGGTRHRYRRPRQGGRHAGSPPAPHRPGAEGRRSRKTRSGAARPERHADLRRVRALSHHARQGARKRHRWATSST